MYIIIGGTGFLGSYVVDAVQRQTREKVIIVARRVPKNGGVT